MLAMKRLPCESFLPSGGLDSFDRSIAPPKLNHQPDAMITPLSLPNSSTHASVGALDGVNSPPASYGPPLSLAGTSGSQQYLRAADHPPSSPLKSMPGSSITSPSMAPTKSGAMSPFEHLSPQTTATLIQRREEHIRRLQENWKAERVHLEASRARAEEMFREERDMMDEERLLWAQQKTKLENEILDWKQRAEKAEAEVVQLTKLLGHGRINVAKLDAIFDGIAKTASDSRRSGSSDSPRTVSRFASRFRRPSNGVSPSSIPLARGSTIPESNPFVPLDPRMQSASPNKTAARPKQERVPSIDINEVIPGLEGIRLRAPAIQKFTFSDMILSLPATASTKGLPLNPGMGLAKPQPKASPSLMTQATLLAPEHRRLTMHAGHTPNHSMSFSRIPTLESTATNTAGSSGTSTPTSPDGRKSGQVYEAEQQNQPVIIPDLDRESHGATGHYFDAIIPEEAILEPSDDDPALKGPLCLKNRPAADEVFLRRLSDKLEEVKATEATPSVLNESAVLNDGKSHLVEPEATCSSEPTNENRPEEGLEDVEEDIPLKLRKSSNFGQPLGQVRRASGY